MRVWAMCCVCRKVQQYAEHEQEVAERMRSIEGNVELDRNYLRDTKQGADVGTFNSGIIGSEVIT